MTTASTERIGSASSNTASGRGSASNLTSTAQTASMRKLVSSQLALSSTREEDQTPLTKAGPPSDVDTKQKTVDPYLLNDELRFVYRFSTRIEEKKIKC